MPVAKELLRVTFLGGAADLSFTELVGIDGGWVAIFLLGSRWSTIQLLTCRTE